MLDQNTDRMWYVIGAVIVGAAIIFLANGTLPNIFASVGDGMQSALSKTIVNDNLLNGLAVEHGWLNDSGLAVPSGTPHDIGDWTSGFIPVEDADYITFSTNGRHQTKRAMFFDHDKNPVSERFLNTEPVDTVMVYDVPEGAAYIRVSSMYWSADYFKVEHGKYATGTPPVPEDSFFGRNLLLNSSRFTMQGEQTSGILNKRVTPEGYLEVTVSASSNVSEYVTDMGLAASHDHIHSLLEEGERFTFSVQVKSDDVSLLLGSSHLSWATGSSALSRENIHGRVGSEWVTLSTTKGTWIDDEFVPQFRFRNIEGTFVFRHPKLERGVAATAYSKAPEDN